MSVAGCIFYLGQELSVKPLACLVPTAPTAHGGSKGRPAGDELHRQKSGSLYEVH